MDYLKIANDVAKLLEADINSRDYTNIPPKNAVQLLQENKLLSILSNDYIKTKWYTALKVVQKIAEVDTSIAHLLGYHYLISSHIFDRSSKELKDILNKKLNQQFFFANSSNPLSKTLFGKETESGFVLNGFKLFSTGSQVANYLAISWDDSEENVYNAIIPVTRNGVTVNKDWDAFGQKQTGSGTVTFKNVQVNMLELLKTDEKHITSLYSLATLLNIYTGAAIGALKKVKEFIETKNKETNDLLHRNAGNLYSKVESLKIVVEHTNKLMDDLWNNKDILTDSKEVNFQLKY